MLLLSFLLKLSVWILKIWLGPLWILIRPFVDSDPYSNFLDPHPWFKPNNNYNIKIIGTKYNQFVSLFKAPNRYLDIWRELKIKRIYLYRILLSQQKTEECVRSFWLTLYSVPHEMYIGNYLKNLDGFVTASTEVIDTGCACRTR